MKILVTGAKGFVGKNLCAQLKNIRDGKAKNYGLQPALRGPSTGSGTTQGPDAELVEAPVPVGLSIDEVFEYDLDSTPEELDRWCAEADFVFNLAGVNRPKDTAEFMAGNFGFASTLLDTLRKHGNRCPVMLSSSQQASLTGRFGNSEYGRSKKAGEDLFLKYGEDTGAKVLVYRFPNLFGKWCRPNYNSAVATFCNAIANVLPYTVNDPSVELELLYIDDLVDEKVAFPLKMNVDARGSFTELVHTLNSGQVSINISKPGITKGQHWHNTKFEQFIVVKGHGLIQQRNLNDPSGEVLEWEVSGDRIEAVHMLPGYTHNIINLSETEDLVTVMYCNEIFNPNKPDTYFDPVK